MCLALHTLDGLWVVTLHSLARLIMLVRHLVSIKILLEKVYGRAARHQRAFSSQRRATEGLFLP